MNQHVFFIDMNPLLMCIINGYIMEYSWNTVDCRRYGGVLWGVPPNHPLYTFESGFFYPNHLWKPPIFRIGIFPAEKNWEPHGIGWDKTNSINDMSIELGSSWAPLFQRWKSSNSTNWGKFFQELNFSRFFSKPCGNHGNESWKVPSGNS